MMSKVEPTRKVAAKPRPAVGMDVGPYRLVWRPRVGSQPDPREALGHRPPSLRRAARKELDVTGSTGRNARAEGSQGGLPESRKSRSWRQKPPRWSAARRAGERHSPVVCGDPQTGPTARRATGCGEKIRTSAFRRFTPLAFRGGG